MAIYSQMTTYDLVVAGLVLFFIGLGLWQGFLKQVTGLLALYFGYFAASQHSDTIYPLLRGVSNNPKVIFLLACVIVFIVTYFAVMLMGRMLKYLIKLTIIGWFDHLSGGIVGFAKGAIVAIIVHMALGTILSPQNKMLMECRSCTILNNATAFTWRLVASEEMRASLLEQEPAKAMEVMKNYLAPGGASGPAETEGKPPGKPNRDEGKRQ